MPSLPIAQSEQSLEAYMFYALHSEHPKSLSAKTLMNRAGLAWRRDPVMSFASLCICFGSLNKRLSGTRWQAIRTGGTPDDLYRISRLERS